MQVIMQNSGVYEISLLEPLRFINMDPNNIDEMYTSLTFAADECKKQNIATCLVIFDQPLFIKASDIISGSEELNNVIVRLGVFHLKVSYMGAVGYIVSGSGIGELWSCVYGTSFCGAHDNWLCLFLCFASPLSDTGSTCNYLPSKIK